jgi:hypothetical protein
MRERDVLASGDVRRMHTTFVWHAASVVHKKPLLAVRAASCDTVRFANVFEASRSLLQRRAKVEDWVACAEPRDVDLLCHHLPSAMSVQTGPDDLDRLADGLDAFSALDAGMPSRYECRDAHMPFVMDAATRIARVAATVASTGRGGGGASLGALAPPPRLPRTRADATHLDMPANLVDATNTVTK